MKLSENDKRIIREDIRDLKWLIEKYNNEGKHDKARACEIEMEQLKKKLKGEN